MSAVTHQLVSEIETLDDYRQACMVVQSRIQGGAEVDWTLLHALAVKGHLLAAESGEAVTVAEQFLAVHRAEPNTFELHGVRTGRFSGTMEDNDTDDRG